MNLKYDLQYSKKLIRNSQITRRIIHWTTRELVHVSYKIRSWCI